MEYSGCPEAGRAHRPFTPKCVCGRPPVIERADAQYEWRGVAASAATASAPHFSFCFLSRFLSRPGSGTTGHGREASLQQVLSRELLTHLDKQIQYTVDCRPQSMAMGNAIKWLKMRVGSRAVDQLSSAKAREMLSGQIDTFIEERVTLADKAILSYAESRIAPDDVVLIYGGSQVIETVLVHAHAQVSPRRM